MRWLPLVAVALLVAHPAAARLGDLDASFGIEGIASVQLGAFVAHCYGVARQPDGALVLAGGSDAEIDFDDEYDATLVRLLPDGALDPAFGNGGIVVRRTGQRDFESTFKAVALGGDGAIVAAGHESSDGTSRTLIARFDASGRPDPSFGAGGRVYVSLGEPSEATAVAVQRDATVLVAVSIWLPGALPGGAPGYDFHNDVALVRLAADGTLDASFGDGGVRVLDMRAVEYSLDMVAEADGAAVIAVALLDGTTLEYDVGLVRVDASGALDRSWGDDGLTLLDLGFLDYRARLIGLSSGRVLVLSGAPGIALARLGSSGHLDPTFGHGGITHVAPEFWYGRAVAVDALERPLVAALDATGEIYQPRLLRFTKNGRLRRPLARSAPLPFDAGHLVIQPDGKAQAVTFDVGASWLATRLGPRVGPPIH